MSPAPIVATLSHILSVTFSLKPINTQPRLTVLIWSEMMETWSREIVIRMTDTPITMFYSWPVEIIAERGWVRSERSSQMGLWVIDSDQDREEGYRGQHYGPAVKIMQERRESGVIIMSSGEVMESWPGSMSIILIRENISSASGSSQKPAQSPLLSPSKLYSASTTSTSWSRNVSWKDTTTSRTNLLVLPTVSGLIFNFVLAQRWQEVVGKEAEWGSKILKLPHQVNRLCNYGNKFWQDKW